MYVVFGEPSAEKAVRGGGQRASSVAVPSEFL